MKMKIKSIVSKAFKATRKSTRKFIFPLKAYADIESPAPWYPRPASLSKAKYTSQKFRAGFDSGQINKRNNDFAAYKKKLRANSDFEYLENRD
jgi:hypothetical protein